MLLEVIRGNMTDRQVAIALLRRLMAEVQIENRK